MKIKGENVFVNYLALLGVRFTESFSEQYFNEHPHRYNLFGLSKMLLEYGVENATIRIPDKGLPQLALAIKQYGLELLIISDKPYSQDDEILALKPSFVKYEHDISREQIAKTDILLNPRSNIAYFRYKSNNKSVIAWKLGVPVAATNDDIV